MVPAGLRHALAAGPEAVRHRPPQPRDERGLRRGTGAVRRPERHPQALLPHRVQLPHRSARATPSSCARWFDAVGELGLERGALFDLDFHTIPFHGEDALVEKHYVSKRSRRQKGMLAFLAQDAEHPRLLLRQRRAAQDQQNDEILRFVEFWKQRTGQAARGTDLRLQADHLCQPEPAQPDGHRLHHPAPAVPQAAARRSQQAPPRPGDGSSWRTSPGPTAPRGSSTSRSTLHGLRRADPADHHHRPGPRGADLAADQPAQPLAGQAHRPLRPAHAHREQHRRRHRLLPHGRPLLGRGHEGQLRPATDPDGQQPLPPARRTHRPTATNTAKSRHLFRDFVDATAQISITDSEVGSNSRNAPTTRCCWPPTSRPPGCRSPGCKARPCSWPSAEKRPWC